MSFVGEKSSDKPAASTTDRKKKVPPPIELRGPPDEAPPLLIDAIDGLQDTSPPLPRSSSDDLSELVEHSQRFRADEFEKLEELGTGSGGIVYRVRHRKSSKIMALKILGVGPGVKDQVIRELKILTSCQSIYIVKSYGSFYSNGQIHFLMEYMNGGSLDHVLRRGIRMPEELLGRVGVSVVKALVYLKAKNVLHRDIKPLNILMNSVGDVKLCDFGVSRQLSEAAQNAQTFVGSFSYMAPERLIGAPYTAASDVWSLGLSLMELVLARHPIPHLSRKEIEAIFSSDRTTRTATEMSVMDQMDYIIHYAAPSIPAGFVSPQFKDFLDKCVQRDTEKRPSLLTLLKHPFLTRADRNKPDLAGWLRTVLPTFFHAD